MVLNNVLGVVAIRMNEWKYIEGKAAKPLTLGQQKNPSEELSPRLHNLRQDPAEANNVIDAFPEIAQEMQETLDRIRLQGSERMRPRKADNDCRWVSYFEAR